MTKITRYINTNTSYSIRTEKLQGKDNIVIPVIMMIEGVHCGSAGPVLHTATELKKVVDAWNGIPVIINHPQINGQNVSANIPKIIDKEVVGKIFNARISDLKLKAEAWIEIDRINTISPTTLAKIRNNKPIDVSVGVYTEDEDKVGIYNNEEYEHIAHNYRPDHLALLPEDTGACSFADGCGIRLNKKGEKNVMVKPKLNLNNFHYQEGGISFVTNKEEYLNLVEKLHNKLYSLNGENSYHYLKQVYSDYMIFGIDGSESDGKRKFYKQKYIILKDGDIELSEKEEVKENIKYTKITNNKKEVNMPKVEKCTPCIEKKAADLIANKLTTFKAGDKEWLEAQTEERLDSFIPVPVAPIQENKKVEKEVVIEKTPIEVLKESLKSPEDFMNLMPKDMRESVNDGLNLYKANKAKMVKSIMDNSKDVWNAEELNVMNSETLTKIYKSTNVDGTDYSINAIENNTLETNKEVLLPPGTVLETK